MLATCYVPSGDIAQQDVPCNALASCGVSACCKPDDVCLDTGYCLTVSGNAPNVLSRGTCTDPTFGSSICPQQCEEVNPDGIAVLNLIDTGLEATFCCGSYNSVSGECDDATGGSKDPFSLQNGRMITNRTDGTATSLHQLLPLASKPQTTVTVTATATATASADCSTTGYSQTTIIAIAVPLVVLLLASLAAVWFLWRALKQARQDVVHNMAVAGTGRVRSSHSQSSRSPIAPANQPSEYGKDIKLYEIAQPSQEVQGEGNGVHELWAHGR